MRERELRAAIEAAKAAANIIRGYFGTEMPVHRKSDDSPVTAADREAEQRIVEMLTAAFPGHGVLGEEYGERRGSGSRWIIDPIDGTKSFVRKLPYFATLIALEEDGEVTLGVVHEPISGDLFYAVKGGGAYGPKGRLVVSACAALSDGMVVFGGLNAWREANRWPAVERLVDASARQRGYGDYLGHVCVARGQAEAMVELDLKPWDMAALKILVEEAGGRFTDLADEPTIYGSAGIATNGRVHAEVLGLIRGGS